MRLVKKFVDLALSRRPQRVPEYPTNDTPMTLLQNYSQDVGCQDFYRLQLMPSARSKGVVGKDKASLSTYGL